MAFQRSARVLLLSLAGAGLALVGLAGPASAHDRLVSTDPADGSTVVVLPTALTLEFSEGVMPTGTQVVVTTGGTDVGAATPQIDDATVTVPLPPDLANGDYDVAWRVVSADGHPIEGTFRFALAVPGADATTPAPATAAPADQPTDQATGQPTDDASAVPAGGSAASPEATAAPDSDGVASRGPLVGVVVALAVAGTVAALMVRRQRGGAGVYGPPGQS